MQLHTILVVLPSGNHNILNISENYINTLINKTELINGFVGPLLNTDIESNDTYHIYCNITKQKLQMNIPLTNFISKQIDDHFVNGDAYVIKKCDDNYMNINKDDIDSILDILNTTINFNIKIKAIQTISSDITDNDKISYSYESNEESDNSFCCC